MATVEERLASWKRLARRSLDEGGRVEEHSQSFVTIREMLVAFEHRMDARFDGIERRFDVVDRRFEGIDPRFETLDTRFVWLIGLYVTSVIAFAIAAFSRP
jgi:hypothetical protein